MYRALLVAILLGLLLTLKIIVRWKCDWFILHVYPSEILLFDSAAERFRAHKQGRNAFVRQWSTWMALALYTAIGMLSAVGLSALIDHLTMGGPWRAAGLWFVIIMSVLIPFGAFPLMYVRYRRWMRVFLRRYLSEQGIPVCQKCGYDLRGLETSRCPECGTHHRDVRERSIM